MNATITSTTITRPADLVGWAADLGQQIALNARRHDEDGSWVDDSFDHLRAKRLSGARRPDRARWHGRHRSVRSPRSSASWAGTADRPRWRLAMHQHVTCFTAWRYRRGLPGAEATLRRVADEGIVLVSTGGGRLHPSPRLGDQGRRRLSRQRAQDLRQPVTGRHRDVDDVPVRRSRTGTASPQHGHPVRGPGRHGARHLEHDGHARHGQQRRHDRAMSSCPTSGCMADRPYGVIDPPLQVIATIAFPIIAGAYLGVADGAVASRARGGRRPRQRPAGAAPGRADAPPPARRLVGA